MKSRKDTTRQLNIETLAKREVFAANVFASMALPVEKIETPSLVSRFETTNESAAQDTVKQKNQQAENQRHKQPSFQTIQNKRLSSKADALRDKLSTSELDSFKESGRDLSRKGRVKGISEGNLSGVGSDLGNGLNDSRSPLNNLSGRTSMGTSRNAAASNIAIFAAKQGFVASAEATDTCVDDAILFVGNAAEFTGRAAFAAGAASTGAGAGMTLATVGPLIISGAGTIKSGINLWECMTEETESNEETESSGTYSEEDGMCIENGTPNPQDEEVGEGRLLFGDGTIDGRRELANKKKEIASNSNGYGAAGPNPMAGEKSSGGPLYITGNHDDGNNHVKEKVQSTGRIEDIVVKAGGGATDPHANTFAANVDSVLSRWGR